jgi:hypothetical protein
VRLIGQAAQRLGDLRVTLNGANGGRVLAQVAAQCLFVERRRNLAARPGLRGSGHDLRFGEHGLRAEGQLFTICVFTLRPRHFSKAASMPRITASSGTPAFFQFSMSAQSSVESRNRLVPRARWKCSSISVK